MKENIERNTLRHCSYCGKEFQITAKAYHQHLCSDECRRMWHNTHRKSYNGICNYCGKTFTGNALNKKYCSRECFTRAEFYKQEDISVLCQKLIKGEICMVPVWIKKLIK